MVIGGGVTLIGGYAFSDCSSLTDIYYKGSEEEWVENESLSNATIHYNYEG